MIAEKKMFKKRIVVIVILIGILIGAFWIRHYTFFLPHDNGDQLFYLALAMKLDKFGFAGYTLRGVDLAYGDSLLGLLPSVREKGSLLHNLSRQGVHYYDEPLYHVPPAFSYMLMFSHRLFLRDYPYLTVMSASRVKIFYRSAKAFYCQLYAAVVPFSFSLLFILAVFWLGKMLFSDAVGLCAASLLTISPIDILTSQKIWSEDMLCFFIAVSIIFYLLARRKGNLIYAAVGGLACGIATITKQSGGFVAFIILLFHFWDRKEDLINKRFIKFIFDKYIIVFGLVAIIVSFPWFYSITKTYGLPWSRPHVPELRETVEWFRLVSHRPWSVYLVGIPYQMPIFVLVYPAIVNIFRTKEKRPERIFLALWYAVWIILFTVKFRGKEHRYMLPSYPAIAILSADYLLSGLRLSLGQNRRRWIGGTAVIILIIFCALWSVPMGLKYTFFNLPLITEPF